MHRGIREVLVVAGIRVRAGRVGRETAGHRRGSVGDVQVIFGCALLVAGHVVLANRDRIARIGPLLGGTQRRLVQPELDDFLGELHDVVVLLFQVPLRLLQQQLEALHLTVGSLRGRQVVLAGGTGMLVAVDDVPGENRSRKIKKHMKI